MPLKQLKMTQKNNFVTLLATVGANLLGNLLKSKRVIRAGEWKIRANQDF